VPSTKSDLLRSAQSALPDVEIILCDIGEPLSANEAPAFATLRRLAVRARQQVTSHDGAFAMPASPSATAGAVRVLGRGRTWDEVGQSAGLSARRRTLAQAIGPVVARPRGAPLRR
jgi:hypothetical protein